MITKKDCKAKYTRVSDGKEFVGRSMIGRPDHKLFPIDDSEPPTIISKGKLLTQFNADPGNVKKRGWKFKDQQSRTPS